MTDRQQCPANLRASELFHQQWEILQAASMRPGWSGEVAVTANLRDGVVCDINPVIRQRIIVSGGEK